MPLDFLPSSSPVTMVATLGGQPQVVTFALDALLEADVPVEQVVVLMTEGEHGRAGQALKKLAREFPDNMYAGRLIRLLPQPLHKGQQAMIDIYDESDANAAWDELQTLLARLKAEGHTLHICISGGRRMLGLLTMSAAMLHFGHQDVLWHMFTPRELREEANQGAVMHVPPNSGFRLIRVPLTPWGSIFPVFRELTRAVGKEDGDSTRGRVVIDAVENARCGRVVASLTQRQRDVVRLMADGLTPKQAAARLGVKLSTIDTHKTIIFKQCRTEWDMSDDVHLDYRFIREKFAPYFAATL